MKTTPHKTGLELKSRSAQLSSSTPGQPERHDNRFPIDSGARQRNRTLPTDQVLALLHTANPDLFNVAEVVGKWIWVQFNECPCGTHRQQLAQLGFHWNRERQTWQHPCGAFRLRGAGDPRQKYSSYHPADGQPA